MSLERRLGWPRICWIGCRRFQHIMMHLLSEISWIAFIACSWLALAFMYGFLRPLCRGLRGLRGAEALSMERAMELEANVVLVGRLLVLACCAALSLYRPFDVVSKLIAGVLALLFGLACCIVHLLGWYRFRTSRAMGGYGPRRMRL